MKLSNHSKRRMRERTDLNHKERLQLANEAFRLGKSADELVKKNKDNKKLAEYMLSKPNCKVKTYKGYIFIYSKNSHRLYTMYKIPEHIEYIEK